MGKEVQTSSNNQLRSSNLNLSIFLLLKEGLRPSKICEKLNLSKTALQYYLTSLKESGFIEKIGYGTWKILKEFDKNKFKKSTKVAMSPLYIVDSGISKKVRGHAFQFVLQLPQNLRNWGNRDTILKKMSISSDLMIGGAKRGQKIVFRGRKIWLTDKSIIVYEKDSYFAETAKDSKSLAIYHFLRLIKGLESKLQANFSFGGKYRFKVSRQHYALIKNALARQYDKEGKKLEVYNDKGLWFLIDNSYNLHEAETLHAKTAVDDNEKVQKFFNYIKEIDIEEQFKEISKNMQSVAGVFEQMSNNIVKLTKIVYDLSEKMK